MKNFDRENFILDYLAIDWEHTLQPADNNVNNSMEQFFTKINALLDQYMPLKKISQKEYKRRFKPWITDVILKKIKFKDKVFHKYLKCKNKEQKSELNTQYKTLKNEITDLCRKGKKQYYHKFFSENKNNLKKIWKGIKRNNQH